MNTELIGMFAGMPVRRTPTGTLFLKTGPEIQFSYEVQDCNGDWNYGGSTYEGAIITAGLLAAR